MKLIYKSGIIKCKQTKIKKILCKLNIHFTGYCTHGMFMCPCCGLVFDFFNTQWALESLLDETKDA